jgi:hypothetical protein
MTENSEQSPSLPTLERLLAVVVALFTLVPAALGVLYRGQDVVIWTAVVIAYGAGLGASLQAVVIVLRLRNHLDKWLWHIGISAILALTSGLFLAYGPASLLVPPSMPTTLYTEQSDAYRAAVLALQPAVYYRLDERQGPTAHDASGGANDGRYDSNVTLNRPGIFGSRGDPAVELHGSGGGLTAGGPANLIEGSRDRIVEFWFRSETDQTTTSVLMHSGAVAPLNELGAAPLQGR